MHHITWSAHRIMQNRQRRLKDGRRLMSRDSKPLKTHWTKSADRLLLSDVGGGTWEVSWGGRGAESRTGCPLWSFAGGQDSCSVCFVSVVAFSIPILSHRPNRTFFLGPDKALPLCVSGVFYLSRVNSVQSRSSCPRSDLWPVISTLLQMEKHSLLLSRSAVARYCSTAAAISHQLWVSQLNKNTHHIHVYKKTSLT